MSQGRLPSPALLVTETSPPRRLICFGWQFGRFRTKADIRQDFMYSTIVPYGFHRLSHFDSVLIYPQKVI
jgi:hypothetical protein